MEDSQIIALYWERSETAIRESSARYGAYCNTVAAGILHSREDAEECVSETWLRAWNTIPPEKPCRLAVFFGRITRNLAIDRYRREHAQKYGGGQTALCLEELSECIGEQQPIEDRLALKTALDGFLRSLSDRQRRAFLLRYWYLMPVSEIAAECQMTEGAVKMLLSRLRSRLRDTLEREGIAI